MTLTGPDRDEVFQWDPSEPELMKAMILAGVQIQMPVFREEKADEGSHCDKCDHWDICEGCPYTDERNGVPMTPQQDGEPR